MNEPKPKTPMTDAAINTTTYLDGSFKETVSPDFARSLELKLQEAEARVKDLESNNRYQRGYDAGEKSMTAKLQEAERQLDSHAKDLKGYQDAWYKLNAERDQLIKVVDELAKTCKYDHSYGLTLYGTLHHVQAKRVYDTTAKI